MIKSVDIAAIKWGFVLPGFEPGVALRAIGLNGLCVRKLGLKREVWRVESRGRVFYVKLFNSSGVAQMKGEASAIERLKGLGVPVPVLAATGIGGGSAVLMTEEVAHSRVLKDYFFTTFKGLSRSAQRKAARSFALFIRLLHDKGVFHKDPHMGNILAIEDGGEGDGGKLRFCLLDLGEVRFSDTATREERIANLELINLNFMAGIEPSLKYCFFKAYAEGLLDDKASLRASIEKIELRTLTHASKIWKKKAQRSMTGGKLFAEYTEGTFEVHIKKLWHESGALKELIKDPDKFLESKDAVIFKDGRTVKAGMVELADGRKIFLKRYNRKGSAHTIKNIFRSSRASRVWLMSYGGELRGLLMPEPVAFIEERKKSRVLGRSYIISEFIDGALRLSDIAERNDKGDKEGQSSFRDLLFRIGRELRRMHILGWFHGDLKWNNILVRDGSDAGRPDIFFLDIDGSSISPELGAAEIKKDIKRFLTEIDKFGYGKDAAESFLSGYKSYTLGIRPSGELVNIYRELGL